MLTHKELKKELLKDEEIKRQYDALKPEYELLEKLIQARKKAGLTQKKLAEKLNTKNTNISRLESINSKHSPSLNFLKRYAKALNCKLEINLIPNK